MFGFIITNLAQASSPHISGGGDSSMAGYEENGNGPDNETVYRSVVTMDEEMESKGVAWNDFVIAIQEIIKDVQNILL
jgi:hypothetical protein